MTAEVFAFEGNLPSEKVVSWGTAAIRRNGRVWNPVTGRECSEADAQDLVDDGHLSLLPTPIRLTAAHANRPLVVTTIRLEAVYSEYLLADTGRVGGLAGSTRSGGYQVYVFTDIEAFDRYATPVIDDLLHRVLFKESEGEGIKKELVTLGLTLNSAHPFLLATKVHISSHDPFVRELARANLRDAESTRAFDDALTSFLRLESDYELIYEGGVAEGGGLDLDVATQTFNNLSYIHRHLAPTLAKDYPFLRDAFAPPRFQEMRAASAHLSFSTGPQDLPLGQRLARVVELRAIEAALGGRAAEDIRSNVKFEQAVRSLVNPSPETRVAHRPIDKDEAVPVEEIEPAPQSALPETETLVLLGFQEGLKNFANQIGIRLGPSTHVWVSAIDNGSGEQPEGVEVLQQGNTFLFRPAVFSVERRLHAGRETFFLLRMKLLSAGDSAVLTALPSSVVQGAFLVDLEIQVKLVDDDQLSITGAPSVTGLSGRTLGMSAAWLRTFTHGVRPREMMVGQGQLGRWLHPVRPPKPSALARVLLALEKLEHEAPVADVVATINRLFNVNVRSNNTRREVLNNPELLRFVGDDQKTMQMTDAGQQFLTAYFRAGGAAEPTD